MAAHRFWRMSGIEAYGFAGLELTELHLLAGSVRVDAPALLMASIAPASGALVNLKDDDLGTGAAWNASAIRSLALSWDFGAGGSADVTDIRLAGNTAQKFLLLAVIDWSDDGVTWARYDVFSGIVWPGAEAKTSSSPAGRWALGTVDTAIDGTGMVASVTAAGGSRSVRSSSFKSEGVRQFEAVVLANSNAGASVVIGVVTDAANLAINLGMQANAWAYRGDARAYSESSATVAYGASFTVGDVIGCVVNFAAGTLTFYKNGVSQGAVSGVSMAGRILAPAMGSHGQPVSVQLRTRGFAYPVAGADPWEPRDLVNRSALVRAGNAGPMRVPTSMSFSRPYGLMRVQPIHRGRPDFLTGVLGQGIGRVRGVTLDYASPTNKPYRCRVRLVREADGLVVREVWSNADGTYDFRYVDELQSYTLLAYYLDHGKRAEVSDGLTLANGKVELMA